VAGVWHPRLRGYESTDGGQGVELVRESEATKADIDMTVTHCGPGRRVKQSMGTCEDIPKRVLSTVGRLNRQVHTSASKRPEWGIP
jgi:hypothetical protein